MILTRKRLLVDIFLTRRLSKSLAFCEFASGNFEPCKQQKVKSLYSVIVTIDYYYGAQEKLFCKSYGRRVSNTGKLLTVFSTCM